MHQSLRAVAIWAQDEFVAWFYRPALVAVGTTAMSPKKYPETQLWKKPVVPTAEFDLLRQWAEAYRKLEDERVGRWRPIGRIYDSPDDYFTPADEGKVNGVFWLVGAKWICFRNFAV